MRKEIIYCDRCGKENALELSVFIDRYMDAAGSMDNEYGTVDLCHACGMAELTRFLGNVRHVEGYVMTGQPFIDRIKRGKNGK